MYFKGKELLNSSNLITKITIIQSANKTTRGSKPFPTVLKYKGFFSSVDAMMKNKTVTNSLAS